VCGVCVVCVCVCARARVCVFVVRVSFTNQLSKKDIVKDTRTTNSFPLESSKQEGISACVLRVKGLEFTL